MGAKLKSYLVSLLIYMCLATYIPFSSTISGLAGTALVPLDREPQGSSKVVIRETERPMDTALIGGVQNKVTSKARVGGVAWPAGVASTYLPQIWHSLAVIKGCCSRPFTVSFSLRSGCDSTRGEYVSDILA
jgi:hypothetical protein